MSNPEKSDSVVNSENKQLIGSSKRKRKSSIIKRNILVEEKSGSNDETEKKYKTEKSCVKKTRTERMKTDKEKTEEVCDGDNTDGSKLRSALLRLPEPKAAPESPSARSDKTSDEETPSKKLKGKSKSSSGENSHKCVNCNFCSEHISLKHSRDEAEETTSKSKRKYACEICAKMGLRRIYSTAEKQKNHMTLMHETPQEEIKKFECTECLEPTWFPTKSKFCYHLGAKHPGIIKFICEICTETFKLKANYKNHLKTHNIVVHKKFSCEVCNGTFVNKAGFEAHKKRFPGPHIKQSCSHCGFSFSREKHMKNHRCKKLLLEEAAARANDRPAAQDEIMTEEHLSNEDETAAEEIQILRIDKRPDKDDAVEAEGEKKNDNDPSKRVVFHRFIPRRSQEQMMYRPVQVQAQNVAEQPVVVQELREIDLEGGTFIAADSDQQFILRDLNGHLVPGNQILQFDINEVQSAEESQVYLADWNVVAPFVIREKSP